MSKKYRSNINIRAHQKQALWFPKDKVIKSEVKVYKLES